MTKDEALAMDLALEALDIVKIHFTQNRHVNDAITAIKQARSAPVQEPVFCEYCGGNDDADFGLPTDHCTDCARPQPAAQPAPVQECLAHGECFGGKCIYTAPPAAQRQWVGLTDDEFENIELGCRSTPFGKIEAMRKVEAKLKEKNNG